MHKRLKESISVMLWLFSQLRSASYYGKLPRKRLVAQQPVLLLCVVRFKSRDFIIAMTVVMFFLFFKLLNFFGNV